MIDCVAGEAALLRLVLIGVEEVFVPGGKQMAIETSLVHLFR
jgi:hypothetical protein